MASKTVFFTTDTTSFGFSSISLDVAGKVAVIKSLNVKSSGQIAINQPQAAFLDPIFGFALQRTENTFVLTRDDANFIAGTSLAARVDWFDPVGARLYSVMERESTDTVPDRFLSGPLFVVWEDNQGTAGLRFAITIEYELVAKTTTNQIIALR